ncbi:MAG: ATP-dependent Clp protease ATP-binding subunit, partial [Planctomycetaceae bacterium]|nr:ATP-dependent Clp protease ATP-binding subunit [Planctomycetaceae bacterium]
QIEQTLRVYGQGRRLRESSNFLMSQLRREYPGPAPSAHRESFNPGCLILWNELQARQPVGAATIAACVLDYLELDPLARTAVMQQGLHLDAPAAAAALWKSLDNPDKKPTLTAVPPVLASWENLTSSVEDGPDLVHRPDSINLERALHSQETRCVILHGEPGCGKTRLVESLAQRVARGQVPFLKGTRFFRMDAASMAPQALESLLTGVLTTVGPQDNLILVIENFGRLMEHAGSGLGRIAQPSVRLRIIGILNESDFASLPAKESQLSGSTWTVPLEPPDIETTLAIVESSRPELEKTYGVSIRAEELGRICQIADKYVVEIQRPKRAMQVLRWACDEAKFEADRTPSGELTVVNFEVAAQAVSHRKNIEKEQIVGTRGVEYYREELEKQVIGQTEAAKAVATRILVTRRGARSLDRPAGVFLFAGQTGTGKTLMAEAVARIYSHHQGSLHKFTMGDFHSEHTSAAFVGAPQGYVGYVQGGGLVNALQKDPNGVLLFDEVEKAHPAVWDTCLELFSKGKITDMQRNTGYANQALIIMTTNLCHDVIDAGLSRGHSWERIVADTKAAIPRQIHEKSGRAYFRPEFLGRIDELIIFKPLDNSTIAKIARLELEKKIQQHKEQSSVLLECMDNDDWELICGWLSDQCQGDPAHGRAIERELIKQVSVPLATFSVPPGTQRTVRVGLNLSGIVLLDEQGNLIGD